MELVKQKQFGDCGPACLAMVLGKELEEITADFPQCRSHGVTEDEMVEYLASHGVPALASRTWPATSVQTIQSVPSLNTPGVLHFIVWDGVRFLDPTHQPLRYPDDAPVVNGAQVQPQWASVILLWPGLDEANRTSRSGAPSPR